MTRPRSRFGVRSVREVASELRRMRDSSCPYSMTFIDEVPIMLRSVVEAKLKEKFEHWYDANVLPLVDDLEKKIK